MMNHTNFSFQKSQVRHTRLQILVRQAQKRVLPTPFQNQVIFIRFLQKKAAIKRVISLAKSL